MANNKHYTLGIRFEKKVVKGIQREYPDLLSTGGTKLDYEEGTDALLWGVPVDFTYHFNGKDYTDELLNPGEWFILPCEIPVKLGVRTGNTHHDFDKPVLVVGLSCDREELISKMDSAIRQFVYFANQIFELAFDRYWEWCDAHNIAY